MTVNASGGADVVWPLLGIGDTIKSRFIRSTRPLNARIDGHSADFVHREDAM